MQDFFDLSDEEFPLSVVTGTDLPFLTKRQIYMNSDYKTEPTVPLEETALDDCMNREIERKTNEGSLINETVYDCLGEHPFKNSAYLPPYYKVTSPEDTTLVFESRFESGNLRRAIKVYEFEYDLVLKADFNTKGNTQWYYFTISNTRAQAKYRFNIINMIKPDSLYNAGMKPCVYSKLANRGWFREGSEICYFQNNMKRKSGTYYYTLSFTVESEHANDTLSLAHCYPYTYTDLISYLRSLLANPFKRKILRNRQLCNSLAGNPCYQLTITSFEEGEEAIKERKGIWLMARVHPGETNASWMMKGLLDFLTSPSYNAKLLREKYVFKIIPMLNPDGVIIGSYRCGLAGVDLNRCWIDPSRVWHPTIYSAKEGLRTFMEDFNVILSCDFHGHSRNHNIFMYGCVTRTKVGERIFPKLMEQSSEIFSFNDCNFGLQKAKESTARIVLFREFGLVQSFTLESSFCGASFGNSVGMHFGIRDLESVGKSFCFALLKLDDSEISRVISEELEVLYPPDENQEEAEEEEGTKKKTKKKKKGTLKKKISEKKK